MCVRLFEFALYSVSMVMLWSWKLHSFVLICKWIGWENRMRLMVEPSTNTLHEMKIKEEINLKWWNVKNKILNEKRKKSIILLPRVRSLAIQRAYLFIVVTQLSSPPYICPNILFPSHRFARCFCTQIPELITFSLPAILWIIFRLEMTMDTCAKQEQASLAQKLIHTLNELTTRNQNQWMYWTDVSCLADGTKIL